MNIQSTFEKDIRSQKLTSGAYEWWYFDATSYDEKTDLVIIFYEGNPFSRRYIKRQQQKGTAGADEFPAISISIYQDHHPVYYSFTEVRKKQACFSNDMPLVQIGKHTMEAVKETDMIIYKLTLEEQLPSGDCMEGYLEFRSIQLTKNLFNHHQKKDSKHCWNVNQPRAQVSGRIQCKARDESRTLIEFDGQGYHDHNMGSEPLKKQFDNWYWGRFHFKNSTLIYYVMNENQQQEYGWLIDQQNQQITQIFDVARREDHSRSLFGLRSARKLILSNNEAEVMIQQTYLLDNGPFYQRFSSDAFLSIPAVQQIESSRGITEYLCPPRIYNRLYWPLINMRVRYKHEAPHWVQRFKTLYRWTW